MRRSILCFSPLVILSIVLFSPIVSEAEPDSSLWVFTLMQYSRSFPIEALIAPEGDVSENVDAAGDKAGNASKVNKLSFLFIMLNLRILRSNKKGAGRGNQSADSLTSSFLPL